MRLQGEGRDREYDVRFNTVSGWFPDATVRLHAFQSSVWEELEDRPGAHGFEPQSLKIWRGRWQPLGREHPNLLSDRDAYMTGSNRPQRLIERGLHQSKQQKDWHLGLTDSVSVPDAVHLRSV